MRYTNRILAAVLSVALVAGAVVLIVEVIAALVGSPPVWVHWPSGYSWAAKTSWDSTVVRIIAISMVVVGLILFVLEVKRPRTTRLAVADSPAGITTAYTRAGVAAAVKSAAVGVDGVQAMSVGVRRRTATVTATTYQGRAFHDLHEPVARAAQARLNELRLQSPPKLRIRIKARTR